jgi:hypothetical protein
MVADNVRRAREISSSTYALRAWHAGEGTKAVKQSSLSQGRVANCCSSDNSTGLDDPEVLASISSVNEESGSVTSGSPEGFLSPGGGGTVENARPENVKDSGKPTSKEHLREKGVGIGHAQTPNQRVRNDPVQRCFDWASARAARRKESMQRRIETSAAEAACPFLTRPFFSGSSDVKAWANDRFANLKQQRKEVPLQMHTFQSQDRKSRDVEDVRALLLAAGALRPPDPSKAEVGANRSENRLWRSADWGTDRSPDHEVALTKGRLHISRRGSVSVRWANQ